jgi:hypothetical protein
VPEYQQAFDNVGGADGRHDGCCGAQAVTTSLRSKRFVVRKPTPVTTHWRKHFASSEPGPSDFL